MRIILLLLTGLLFSTTSISAQKTDITFTVFFKDDNIGTIHATETITGTKTNKDVSTQTDVSIFMISLHVESEVTSIHDNNILIDATAYRHANRGNADIIAHTIRIADKTYLKERNGKKEQINNINITNCVVDLFFHEPKGIKTIFSNSYTDFLPLKDWGNGKYELITPDNKNTFYTYQNGKLITLEVNTPLGKVVSKRN